MNPTVKMAIEIGKKVGPKFVRMGHEGAKMLRVADKAKLKGKFQSDIVGWAKKLRGPIKMGGMTE